jgi:hypothetical protein
MAKKEPQTVRDGGTNYDRAPVWPPTNRAHRRAAARAKRKRELEKRKKEN